MAEMRPVQPRRGGIFGGGLAWGIGLVLLVAVLAVVYAWQRGSDGDEDAGQAASSGIVVDDAWVRATTSLAVAPEATESMGVIPTAAATEAMDDMDMGAASETITAAYMTITNHADEDDVLTGVTCPAAREVQIHETTLNGDVMQMRPLADGLTIPADSSVTLEPGGIHMMLMGIDAVFEPGQTVELVLSFASGKELTVNAEVRSGME